jgi:hypothetical protein
MTNNQSIDSLVQVDKAITAVFIAAASNIQQNGVPFKKTFRSLNMEEVLLERAKELLGKDYLYIEDDAGLRLYIRDTFGERAFAYFRSDATNSLHMDAVHALLFYQCALKQYPDKLKEAEAIFYRIFAKSFPPALEAMARLSIRNRIKPIFELSSKFFRWKRCPEFLNAFMVDLTCGEGYTPYVLERKHLASSTYLVFKGHTLPEADELISKKTDGLVIRDLNPELESRLLMNIMAGDFTSDIFDGYYAPQVIDDMARVEQIYPLVRNTMNTAFSLFVRPQMIEVMGGILKVFQDELRSNPAIGADDVIIHHVSPSRIGVMLKDGLTPEVAFGSLADRFVRAEPLSLDREYLLSGGWL